MLYGKKKNKFCKQSPAKGGKGGRGGGGKFVTWLTFMHLLLIKVSK